MIEPTQGRIVYFFEGGQRWPAIITEVIGPQSVTLKVLTATEIHSVGNVQLLQDNDKPEGKRWAEWMDYQKGQAAKSDSLVESLLQRLQVIEDRFSPRKETPPAPEKKK